MRPTWPRVAVLLAVLGLAFVASRACQDAQIKVSETEAIAAATEEVDFEPERTQVRLLRQGLNSRPYWFISLSIPLVEGENPDLFSKLAVVKIDASSGNVVEIREQSPEETAEAKAQAAEREAALREAQAADQQEP